MKKNAFTLVQIICSIIVIGIVSIFLFSASKYDFSKNRNDFYNDLLTKVSGSGEDFFEDNSKYIPKEIFEGQKVTLGTLVANDYLDKIVDYNKKDCSNDSYVIAIKMDDNKYVYKTCLICRKDDFSNMSESYCDSSWTDSSTISYGIVDEPLIYISKGSELRDKLDIPLSLIKRNYNGNVIAVLNKNNEIKVSPKNLSTVNVDKAGEYIIEYEYQGYVSQGKVIVYENPSPKVSIGYVNKVPIDYKSIKTESGYLEDGKWAQKIILTFSKGDYYHTEVSNVVKYQWNKDGVWQDICVGEDYCVAEITSEMNEKVKFRSVDNHGNVSAESKEYLIKIDNTKPNCELKLSGELGENGWYKSNVDIIFSNNSDSASNVKVSNINIKNSNFSKESILGRTHILDTDSITYVGYVEDEAGNFSTCEITFKKDSEKPTCTKSGDSLTWSNQNRNIKYGCSDKLSGCSIKYNGGTITFDYTTQNATIPTYIIKDNAGNTTTCEERVANVYVDKTNPKCTSSGDSTTWTNRNRTIEYGCSDSESGCDNNSNKSILFSSTIKTATIPSYIIKDRAGNTTTCESRTANVYVDKTKPICNYEKVTNYEETGVNVKIDCTDEESGCVTATSREYNLKENKSFTIIDNAGNENTCDIEVIKQIMRSDATCIKYSVCSDSSCGQEQYDCSECKTGKNTCVAGYIYGSWGTCSLTKKECNSLEGVECEACGNNGYYHARSKTLDPCLNGSNTCKYGCSTKNKSCRAASCGCELYGDFKDYYKVSSCTETETNTSKTKCKIIYK